MSRPKLTFPEWLAKYRRTAYPGRVFVRCECDWDGCEGWALAYTDSLEPWEHPVDYAAELDNLRRRIHRETEYRFGQLIDDLHEDGWADRFTIAATTLAAFARKMREAGIRYNGMCSNGPTDTAPGGSRHPRKEAP